MLGNEHPSFFEERYYKVYGPIPVPQACVVTACSENDVKSSDLDSLAVIFHVDDDLPTQDVRSKKFGKDIIAWIIFKPVDKLQILRNIEIIEQISEFYLQEIKFLSELDNTEYFSKFLEELENSLLEEIVNKSSEYK